MKDSYDKILNDARYLQFIGAVSRDGQICQNAASVLVYISFQALRDQLAFE